MNYIDVYYSRINHMGETVGERIRNGGIRSFERWLNESPFTIWNLSVERGIYFSGIIERHKDKEESKIMNLYVALDIPIQTGDLLLWQQDDGTIEHWLLFSERKDANPKYRRFWIIKCNFEIKWIDGNGRLRKSWSYVVSSVDDKVKANFRMWHNLISPQPNKYAEIMMPEIELNDKDKDQLLRGINFIVKDEAWKVIECDWTSVPGITYMSLTESKVNFQYDDRELKVADTDRLATFPTLNKLYTVGDIIEPNFSADTFNEWEVELIIPDECDVVAFDRAHEHLYATAAGQVIIQMQLKGRTAVRKSFEITINEPMVLNPLYIVGEDSIKLDRKSEYSLSEEIVHDINLSEDEVQYSLQETDLATIQKSNEHNKCVVWANKKNKLGTVVLVARYNNKEYTKTINIIPLW